jgi:hypothetical protein
MRVAFGADVQCDKHFCNNDISTEEKKRKEVNLCVTTTLAYKTSGLWITTKLKTKLKHIK